MSQSNQSFIEYKASLYQRTKETALHHLTECKSLKRMRGMVNLNKVKRDIESLPAERFTQSRLSSCILTFGLKQEDHSWEMWINTPQDEREDLWDEVTISSLIASFDANVAVFKPLINILNDISRLHGQAVCYRAKESIGKEAVYAIANGDKRNLFIIARL